MNTSDLPEVEEHVDSQAEKSHPWKVLLYNDDIHTFDEVILQLQKATGCSVAEAERIAVEAHFRGKAVAFEGSFQACYRVVQILRQIHLITEILG